MSAFIYPCRPGRRTWPAASPCASPRESRMRTSPPAQGTQSGPFEIHVYLAVKKGNLYLPGQNTFRKAQICLFASADQGRLAKRWSSFFPLPAVRVAMVTKWTLAIKASFPRCCGWSFEVMDTHHASGASVRLAKTPTRLVVVHDVPGPLAVFRERGVGKSQWRALHMSAADVRFSPRQYWRCYFHVQRYLSPEVSVHFIFLRLSISGELRTIDSGPEACTCTFVTNLAGHSAIVKRKKKRNQHEQVLPRTNSAFLFRRCRTCIGPATQIKTLFIWPERACDLKGVRNEQAARRRYQQRPIDVLVDWMIACTQ